jgi:hypothetical protein
MASSVKYASRATRRYPAADPSPAWLSLLTGESPVVRGRKLVVQTPDGQDPLPAARLISISRVSAQTQLSHAPLLGHRRRGRLDRIDPPG